MFPLESGVYVGIGTVLGSLIAGGFVMINNNLQLKREREQRIWQAETDRQKWYREKIYDAYSRSIQVLTKIIQCKWEIECSNEVDEKVISDRQLAFHKLTLEFLSEFITTIPGYPPCKNPEEIKEKMSSLEKNLQLDPPLCRTLIADIMQQDSRINGVGDDTGKIIKE